jgi:hypothetical protein
MTTAADAVRSLYADIAAGRHGEELRDHFTPDARTVERPNVLVPEGRVSDLEAMLAGSTAGAGILARQEYDVRSLVEQDGLVVVRLRWTGTVAATAGPFQVGQELVAHIAQFVRVVGGRIAEIETYDCYEPF